MAFPRVRSGPPRTVAVVAYDGLCTFEFGIAVEIFGLRRPELGVEWYDFTVCSFEKGPLRASGGVKIHVASGPSALKRADTIVIPGWKGPDVPPSPAFAKALRAAHARGARLVTICSGVFVLAQAGILDGRTVTTHWRYAEKLQSQFPKLKVDPCALYIEDGNIMTSAGSAAGLDLGLSIVRHDYGAEIANRVARRLVVAPHREGGQSQYIQAAVPEAKTSGLAPVLDWAQRRLNEDLSVSVLARRAMMSERTFARKFRDETGTTPHQWLTHQRLLAAQRRLETSSDSMDEVAEAVGLDTAATLRLHFRRTLRTTPTAYRRRFTTTPQRSVRI
jgi:AraC family transcriptional activator FtrA